MVKMIAIKLKNFQNYYDFDYIMLSFFLQLTRVQTPQHLQTASGLHPAQLSNSAMSSGTLAMQVLGWSVKVLWLVLPEGG